MADKETHPIRNSIIAGVAVTILASLWPAARSLFVTAFSWVWGTVRIIVKIIVDSYEIPGWLILIFIALAAPTCIRMIASSRKRKEPGVFDLYRRDLLFGAIWE
ncbi:MAG: hypothetical protein AB1711_03565 [Thermodesulfobacteriota bacterium]